MEVWISYHALASGIIKTNAIPNQEGDIMYNYGVYTKDQYHKTFKEAKAHAEEMRANKIADLKEQIKKLEQLNFGNDE